MSQLVDSVIQQVDRVRDIDTRPATVLIFFNKGRENVELVARFGPGCCAPELFDLPNSRGMIVVVSNGVNLQAGSPRIARRSRQLTLSYSACVPMNLINAMLLPKSKATIIRKLPPAISNLAARH
jgi:hypothetical protein